MSLIKSFLEYLEMNPNYSGIESEWKKNLGSVYPIAEPFITRTNRMVDQIECTIPNGCGLRHDVRMLGENRIKALSAKGKKCKDFDVTPDQVVVRGWNYSAFAEIFADPLNLSRIPEDIVNLPNTVCLGDYIPFAGNSHFVFFTVQDNQEDFSKVIRALVLGRKTPIIISSPTSRWHSKEIRKFVAEHKAALLPLSQVIDYDPSRGLFLCMSLVDALPQFHKDIAGRQLLGFFKKDTGKTNVFINCGKFWMISFERLWLSVPHLIGFTLIRYLIRHPGYEFMPGELYGLVKKKEFLIDDDEPANATDRKSLKIFKVERDHLNESIEIAKANNDLGLMDELVAKREKLDEQIRKDEGLGGRIRQKVKKVKGAVRSALDRAFEALLHECKLCRECRKIYLHFRNSIQREKKISYEPESSIDWITNQEVLHGLA